MHTKNLGTDQELYSSTLAYITHYMVAGNPEDTLVQVMEWIQLRGLSNVIKADLNAMTDRSYTFIYTGRQHGVSFN